MREIKFRVWDNHKKKMSLVCQIHYADDGFAETVTIIAAPKAKYHEILINGENGELMQFTGLKDKNGKEIYEGDLVAWKHLDSEPYEVYYNSEECHFFAKHQDPEETESYLDSEKMEIIGNIFEHKHLLIPKEQ